MTKSTFILFSIGYYIVAIIIVAIVLIFFNKRNKKRYLTEIEDLEKEKNLLVSAALVSELAKVEALVNNEELKKQYESWKNRIDDIRNIDVPKITDEINEIQLFFEENDQKSLKSAIIKAEMDINYSKTKADFLLSEIKDITLSEERNREKITKLKSEYRAIVSNYRENSSDFNRIKKPIELQFENVDKLFSTFEKAMDNNAYTEVSKIVKAIDDIVSNLKIVVEETRIICQYGENLIPKKIEDISLISKKMTDEGYNLDYLNIEYNIEEADKKIADIFQRLNVLNVEDSIFELKTMHDYFDSLYSDFDKERLSKKFFDDYSRNIILKLSKLERINNELYKKIGDLKYSYDLSDEEVSIILKIKDGINDIRSAYERTISSFRSKLLPYSKLAHELEIINEDMLDVENKLTTTIKSFGSLKEDEKRAYEQRDQIKKYLCDAKDKVRSYKLPIIPKNYYVELSEAVESIEAMEEELDKRPISIATLNLRVDNARDLVLKVYNTINECSKSAKMAEMAIVYGNRYRTVNKDVDFGLTKAESAFRKGNYKSSLAHAINAINFVEPGIYDKLLKDFKN